MDKLHNTICTLLLSLLLAGLTACDFDSGSHHGGPGTNSSQGVDKVTSIDFNSEDDEFAPLGDIIKDADLVGLGESVHTVGAYYATKARIFKWMVENKDFRAFAWETPWIMAKSVNDYIQTCEGDVVETIYQGLFGVWADVSVVELLQWMCQWNQLNPDDRVYFYGWDSQNPWRDVQLIQNTIVLNAQQPDDLMSGLDACHGYGYSSREEFYDEGYDALISTEQYEQCLSFTENAKQWLSSQSSLSSSVEGIELKIALTSIAGKQSSKYFYSQLMETNDLADYVKSYEARDAANADIIDIYRNEMLPGVKTALWAHNTHIQFGHVIEEDESINLQIPLTTTGVLLKQRHPGQYKTIGLLGYDVKINWLDFPDQGIPESPDALETLIKNTFQYPYAIINLEEAIFIDPNLSYEMGRGRMQGQPIDFFDGLFYIEDAWARVYP